ncbi:ATP-grasp domain-containing protein [Streptomyces sp. NPDC058308]|uniref:ATP-grasp domain-containing protein n=1 Tax=Streptomyces sp. NPDC058308 TaxID=3346440 RepID=UPI0036EC55DA
MNRAARRPRRILVTGVGGAPGLDLARQLLELGCDVIAADADPLAPGLLLAGVTPRVVPVAGHPQAADELMLLCRELRPDALMSTVEAELPMLGGLAGQLHALGVRTWLPGPAAITAAIDKAVFHDILTQHAVPTPHTMLPGQTDGTLTDDGREWVVKPRRGQGAKNVHFCWTRAEVHALFGLVPDPIIQAKVEGREFTADCLVDRVGRASLVLRWRLLVKGGLAVVSSTFADEQVSQVVTAALAAVGAAGPCCVQGFVCDEPTSNRVVLTEMNMRFAGAFLLSQAAGADLVQQALNGLFGEPVDHSRLRYRPGLYLTKSSDTLAVGDVSTLPADRYAPRAHRSSGGEQHDDHPTA